MTVALNADIRIASDDARFGSPAARLGLAYGYGGVKHLVDLVGPAFAREITFSARQLSAEEALRIGLVNRVVPVNALEETVLELANSIASNAPLSVKAFNLTISEVLKDASERDLDAVKAFVKTCFESQDYIEGRKAFMEKRTPNFIGR